MVSNNLFNLLQFVEFLPEGHPLDDPYEMGAAGGDSTGKDKADDVSHNFEDDNPPRVIAFHACFLCLLGVSQNGFDLFLTEFDFHVFWFLGLLLNMTGRFSFSFEGLEPS